MDENQNNDAIQDMVANADNTATNQQITNNKVAKPQERLIPCQPDGI